MEAPKCLKQCKKIIAQKTFEFALLQHQLNITISSKNIVGKIAQIAITQDSFPSNLKVLFQDIQDLYEFLSEESSTENPFQCQHITQLTLLILVRRNITKVNIDLVQKEMSRQHYLQRKIEELQQKLKYYQRENVKQKGKSNIQNNKQFKQLLEENRRQVATIRELTIELQKLKKNVPTPSDPKQLYLLTKQIVILRDQNTKLTVKNLQHQNQITTLKSKISQIETELNQKSTALEQINQFALNLHQNIAANSLILNFVKKDGPVPNPEGNLLVFKPNPESINYNFYSFQNNYLTKTIASGNGQAKAIHCDTPLPSTGRYFYKMQLKLSCTPPNFRLGIIGRSPATEVTIRAGDEDVVMYYCFDKSNQMIYSGPQKSQGFGLGVYDVLTVAIDMDKKKVQWLIQGQQHAATDFSPSLVAAKEVYFFLQYYVTGDQVEMLTV